MSSESKQQGSGGFFVSFIFFVLITFCDHYVQIENNLKNIEKTENLWHCFDTSMFESKCEDVILTLAKNVNI